MMTMYVSATGAKAALLKTAGRGLLDEELMAAVAQDMELIGKHHDETGRRID